MTNSLETIKSWWSPEIKYDWQKEHQENFKSRRNTKRDTTSTSNNNPGLPRKNWDYQEQTEISENSGLPEKSQGLATPRSKPLGLVQQHWRKNEGYRSKKWLIKGPVQSSNKKDLQSDAVYIHVLYSFTVVRLLVYPVSKPSPPGKLLNFTEIHW